MDTPIPYLAVVWSVGLVALHLYVFHIIHMSLKDERHYPRVVRENARNS